MMQANAPKRKGTACKCFIFKNIAVKSSLITTEHSIFFFFFVKEWGFMDSLEDSSSFLESHKMR